jgi:hypothetical protein
VPGSGALGFRALWPTDVRRAAQLLRRPKVVGIIAAVILLAGATCAAVIYLSNTPDYVYARGIKNSGRLVDNLATYTQQLQSVPHKSVLLDSSMQGSDILGHYTINLHGTENNNGDGLFSASGNVDDMPLSSDIRTVAVPGSALPDAYVKSKDLNALQPLVGVQGLPTFNQFDGKWILVDHNLMESYLDNLMRIADKNIRTDKPSPSPTLAQVSDALTKVQAVSKRYLFTTDSSTAVLKESSFVGTESSNGRQLNHYRVTYDAAHLAAFLRAFGQALDSSKLNAWSQASSQGKSLSQTLDLSSLGLGARQRSTAGSAADIWIDRGSKLTTKIQFNNPSPTLKSIVITEGYKGGDLYPFAVTYTGKDEEGTRFTATATATLNTDTHTTIVALSDRSQTSGLQSVLNARVSLTPSNTTVDVNTPAGAVPFLTILEPSGLSELAKP